MLKIHRKWHKSQAEFVCMIWRYTSVSYRPINHKYFSRGSYYLDSYTIPSLRQEGMIVNLFLLEASRDST